MLEFILHTIFWASVGWLTAKYMRIKLKREMELNKEVIEKIAKNTHFIAPETHNGIEYWFDSKNNEFIAQGKSQSEIIDHCKSRFPNHVFFGITASSNKVFQLSGPDWEPRIANIDLTKILK